MATKSSLVFGICGGYQLLGSRVEDPHGIESPLQEIEGLGLIPLQTKITKEKTTILSKGTIVFNNNIVPVEGYEIHMGESVHLEGDKDQGEYESFIHLENRVDGRIRVDQQVIGTYFHGIFHNDQFREILLNDIRSKKGLPPIEERVSFNTLREEAFNRLASGVRNHTKLDYIYGKMEEFQNKG